MGFWGDFFKIFAKEAVKTVSDVTLDSVAADVKAEIDKNKKLKPKEREYVKKGVDLLLDRAKEELEGRL